MYSDSAGIKRGSVRASTWRTLLARSAATLALGAVLIALAGCAVSPVSVSSQGQLTLVLDDQGRLPTFGLECGEFDTERSLQNCQAYRFDPDSRDLAQVSQGGEHLVSEIQSIPGSDRLLSVKNGDLYVEKPEGASSERMVNLSGQIRTPRVSPNGQWLALTHQEIEGGFEILSNPEQARIKHWSLQIRAFDPPQAEPQLLSLPDVIDYEWTGTTLWALTLMGRSHDQIKRIQESGNVQLALQRVDCNETECRSRTQWTTDVPSESVSLYAGIPTKLAPQAFLAVDADTQQAGVVAMTAPPSEEPIAPHRRGVARLIRIDLDRPEPDGRAVRRNAFHPTFGPEGRLVYWAPSAITEAAGQRTRPEAPCLIEATRTRAGRQLCLEVGTAIYRRQADGTEQRLTPKRDSLHLLLSQTFWVDERQLGYVAFETQSEAESDSNGVTISRTILKAVDLETHRTTNLSQLIQSVMDKRDDP